MGLIVELTGINHISWHNQKEIKQQAIISRLPSIYISRLRSTKTLESDESNNQLV